MSYLAIMTQDLSSYFMTPSHLVTREVYERDIGWHLNPNSYMYGAVLVAMETQPAGWTASLSFAKSNCRWRPSFNYRIGPVSLVWLGFTVFFRRDYMEVPGPVIADHLGASKTQGGAA
jgi:hypothetical protein